MTTQFDEMLIFEGKETPIAFFPPLPKGHPRVIAHTPEDEGEALTLSSTACWRRYIGIWEIKDGRLFLNGLVGWFRLVGTEPLLADWFSGVIPVPRGKILQEPHLGYAAIYEEDIHITIEKGVVVGTQIIDNRGKRIHDPDDNDDWQWLEKKESPRLTASIRNALNRLLHTMTTHKSSIVHWIRSHIILSAAILLTVILAAKAINTPATNSLLETPDRAIERARLFSNYILMGDEELLLRGATQDIVERVRSSPLPSFRDVSESELWETKLLPLMSPLLGPARERFSPPESRMQIVRLERRSMFFVMSFAVLADSYRSDFIEADGEPLVVSVAVKYIEDRPDNPIAEWRNRLANIGWFPSAVREIASGDWYLIDYHRSFNLREYYGWVRKNEKRLHEDAERSNKKALSEMQSEGWIERMNEQIGRRANDELAKLYAWSSTTCETQFADVMAQLSRKSNSTSESLSMGHFDSPTPTEKPERLSPKARP